MATTKWGGPFTTVDRLAGITVRGQVFGELNGNFGEEAELELKIRTLRCLTDVLAAWPRGLADAFSRKDVLGHEITVVLAPFVRQLGATAQVTVTMIGTDPTTEAVIKAAAENRSSQFAEVAKTMLKDAPLAPGCRVLVYWSDGQKYPAIVKECQVGQCLVVFSNNSELWVDDNCLVPE